MAASADVGGLVRDKGTHEIFRGPVPHGAEVSEDQSIEKMFDRSGLRRLLRVIRVIRVIRGQKATRFFTTEVAGFTEGRKVAKFPNFRLKFVLVSATLGLPVGATSTVIGCKSALGVVACFGNWEWDRYGLALTSLAEFALNAISQSCPKTNAFPPPRHFSLKAC